jgi:isoleucyl-tRNA synthetase
MLAEWWESKDGKQIFLTEADAQTALGTEYVKRVGKMAKQKRNFREPREIFDKYGADALRWYFFANQAPWNSILYAERAIKDSIPEFLLRLWNCFSFFTIYANIDGFDPASRLKSAGKSLQLTSADLSTADGYRPIGERSELDRWLLSELNRTLAAVVEQMDAYDNFEACKRINEFVDGLSNWYVRRSRDRFWASMDAAHQADKLDAYWTLYEGLLTTAKTIAPFTPFLAETMWRNLAGVLGDRAAESVHLCDYPTGDKTAVDELLSARMRLLREIASLGLSARMANKLKVRQPLAKVEVILSDATHQAWLEEHDELLRDELNVEAIDYAKDATKYITYQVQPNFKRLGPRLGKLLPACKEALGKADGGQLLAQMTAAGKVTLSLAGETVELDSEDIQVRLLAKEGWAAAQGSGCVVVLSTEITRDLRLKGIARDIIRGIADLRKRESFGYTDKIETCLESDDPEVLIAAAK